jgi:prophage DNA circulation protein
MSWIDRYREASFRNVKFFVSSHEKSGGRRGVVHEFPNQDDPTVEDMGRRARKFNIDAYVLGDDYDLLRNELLEAIEQRGAGTLVHPYLGTMQVVCLGYNLRETSGETRVARFDLQFVQTAEKVASPSSIVDTTGQALRSRELGLKAAQTALINAYSLDQKPFSITQNVVKSVEAAIKTIEKQKNISRQLTEFSRNLINIQGKILELVYSAEELAEALVDLIAFGTDLINMIPDTAEIQFEEVMNLYQELSAQLPEPKSVDDPSILVLHLTQQAAIICAAGLAVQLEYDSGASAKQFQDRVFEGLDALIQTTTDDDLYSALINLRRDTANDLDQRAVSLPNLVEYTPNYTTTVLTLSHLLYGNIDSADEIAARNGVQHPGVVMGGRTLEILRNV